MIVRNESEIILRCLNSAIDSIDYLFITLNGNDNQETVKIITEFIKSNKSSGKLIDGKIFKTKLEVRFNFQDYRNESHVNAFNELIRLNVDRNNQYFLLLDSDMILHSELSKEELKNLISNHEAIGLIQQEPNGDEYLNIRLISNRIEWKCIGRTHEYWKAFKHCNSINISKDYIHIQDSSDGCNKENKLLRDVDLLNWGYDELNDNEYISFRSNTDDETILSINSLHLKRRYAFYLGMNCSALGQYKEAIKWFSERIRLDGWIEEVFYSQYMIGLLYSTLKMNTTKENKIKYYSDLARTSLLDAWLFRPIRIEPLYNFCLNEMNHNIFCHDHFNTQVLMLVYMICKFIVKTKIPDDKLFIRTDIYRYKIKYLLYVSSFFASDPETGIQMYNELKSIDLPEQYHISIEIFKLKFNW